MYLTLTPPARPHGEPVVDHMAAMIGVARRQNRELQEGVRRRRAGQSLGERVELALLGLIGAADPLEWLREELAGTLGIDAAHLCLEGDGCGLEAGETVLLLGGRDVLFRDAVTRGEVLHGAAHALVRRDVLVRVRPGYGPGGLLALGSRDDGLPGPGAETALALLAAAVEAAIERA